MLVASMVIVHIWWRAVFHGDYVSEADVVDPLKDLCITPLSPTVASR